MSSHPVTAAEVGGFALFRGQVTLRVQRDGRPVIVGTLAPGEVLGWSCLRDDPVSLATARATGPVRLVAIPADALLVLLASGSPASLTIMRRLFGVAAMHLAAAREQMIRQGREGVITAG
jgi:CRP-like cAMP-binding protein